MTTEKTKTVLVTGSSSGFGRLTSLELARKGHRVFASMRGVEGTNAAAASEFAQIARDEGIALSVVELDITDQASMDHAVENILATVGSIDVVVNNAGVGNVGVLEGYTMEQVQHLFETNVFGALRVDKAVLPSMRSHKTGLLIHVTTSAARIIVPFVSPYTAAKAALEALAEEFNFELAPFGIESIVVEPGAFPTEIFGKMVQPADADVLAQYGEMATKPAEMFAGMEQMMAGENAPDPQEVADAIADLVDRPAGSRPIRTVVGDLLTAGVADFNAEYDSAKGSLLSAIGAA